MAQKLLISQKIQPKKGYKMTEQEFSRQIEAIAKKDASKLAVFEKNLLAVAVRSEEHTSELQSQQEISYAVFCLKKKNFFNDTATTEIYTLSLHDALPI